MSPRRCTGFLFLLGGPIEAPLHFSAASVSPRGTSRLQPVEPLRPCLVQHHLGPSSEACLVLRRLDEICMDTEGNRGGGRKTHVPFILVGFPWSPELQSWGFFHPNYISTQNYWMQIVESTLTHCLVKFQQKWHHCYQERK